MPDDIESLIEQRLPALTAAAKKGLGQDAKILEQCLPVSTTKETQLVRFDVEWQDAGRPMGPPGAAGPIAGSAGARLRFLKKSEPRVSARAYEFLMTLVVGRDKLLESTLTDDVENLATAARTQERMVVLELMSGARQPATAVAYDTAGVAAAVWTLEERANRQCRLIGAGEVAKDAKQFGPVVDVVDPKGALRIGVGLIVATVNGPRMERVVDDLTLTWRHTSQPDEIELRISERFFLLRAAESVFLGDVSRRPGYHR